MSNVYYGVEPYTGKIICHTGQKGMKWGYTDLGKTLNDRAKVARVEAMNNNRFNKDIQEQIKLDSNGEIDYYSSGLDPKFVKRQLYKGHSNADILKNARNLNAKYARVKAMNNNRLNKAFQEERELEKNNDRYYDIGLDPKIGKRQLYKGHSNNDLLKNAKNLAAKVARVEYMNEQGSQETKRHLRDIMLNENAKNARNDYVTKKGNAYLKKVGRSK